MFIKINKIETKRRIKIIFTDLSIIAISLSIVYFSLIVYAGSLLPSETGAASSTMWSLDDMYNVLAGNYDSAGEIADEDGNAMQILKCITTKMNGGVCS